METASTKKGKSKASHEQAAKSREKEDIHHGMMNKLAEELKAVLNAHESAGPVLDWQAQTVSKVQEALQKSFGKRVGIENIGLDGIGISLSRAPLELALVNHSATLDNPPDTDDVIYEPVYENSLKGALRTESSLRAILQALEASGVYAEIHKVPSWINPESATRAFAQPESAIVVDAVDVAIFAPDPAHSTRTHLLKTYLEKFSSMREVLGLLYIFAANDTDATLPPLFSRILAHLTMAYYRSKYAAVAQDMKAPEPPATFTFYSSPPSSVYRSGRSDDVSTSPSTSSPPGMPITITPPSDFSPTRKSSSTASDFLDLLRWWDQLRWDQSVISPISSQPQSRSFESRSADTGTWDWNHSPLIIQDPVYSPNNLATLLTPANYAALRTSFRVIHRNLRAGLGVGIATRQARPLSHHANLGMFARHVSTAPSEGDMDRLTAPMVLLYNATRPSHDVFNARKQTLKRLDNLVKRLYGSVYTPVLFGSSRYGVSDRHSDLDIVVLDTKRPLGLTPDTKFGNLPDIYKLRRLARGMAKDWKKIIVIDSAKVPIIKAQDAQTHIQVDININERLGLYNTELLEHYCRLWTPLSNLIYIVKKWAAARGLNDPSGQGRGGVTFSSYCLTLMVVGFLQSHRVLPNLQDPALFNQTPDSQQKEEGSYFWIKGSSKSSRVRCDIRWYRMPPEQWRPINNPSVGQAFFSWLWYFAEDHKYDEFAIKISQGGILQRRTKSKKRPSKKEAALVAATEKLALVEDVEGAEVEDGEEPEIVAEAITNDVEESEIDAAMREAKALSSEKVIGEEARAQEEGNEDEILVDTTFVPSSPLDEPPLWIGKGLVVADPFISDKNCAGNIAKKSITAFKNQCTNSVQAINAGMSLNWLLSGEMFTTVLSIQDQEHVADARVRRDIIQRGHFGQQKTAPFVLRGSTRPGDRFSREPRGRGSNRKPQAVTEVLAPPLIVPKNEKERNDS